MKSKEIRESNYPPELDLRPPPPPPEEGDETRCWGDCSPPPPLLEEGELEELEIT